MNNKQQFEKMMKISNTLLDGNYFSDEEKEKIKNSFIDNFYKALQLALDVNIRNEKLKEFIKTKNINDYVEQARFLIETLDNKKTYILMNYYLMNFLLSFGKAAKKESVEQIQTLYAAEGLVPNGFATVVENYKNLTGKTA